MSPQDTGGDHDSPVYFSLLFVNHQDFLEGILQWFPVAFSTVWNSEFFFLDWLPPITKMPKETSSPCYLIYSWREKAWINAFPHSTCSDVNITFSLPIPLSMPISILLSTHSHPKTD